MAAFSLLVQNAGNVPISTLNVIFSRRLYDKTPAGQWQIKGLRDITQQLPFTLRGFRAPAGSTLTLVQPDPNRPQYERPPLAGSWRPGDSRFLLPAVITGVQLSLLYKLKYTFFQVELKTPLAPQEARWFSWRAGLTDIGLAAQGVPGSFVQHQMASPLDVYRTLSELVEAAINQTRVVGPPWLEKQTRDLRDAMGVARARQVDIQYYELVIQPGDPQERTLLTWSAERHLQMRSQSPRIGRDPAREPVGGLLYEWKSGSLLDSPWSDKGFVLHFTLLCKK